MYLFTRLIGSPNKKHKGFSFRHGGPQRRGHVIGRRPLERICEHICDENAYGMGTTSQKRGGPGILAEVSVRADRRGSGD